MTGPSAMSWINEMSLWAAGLWEAIPAFFQISIQVVAVMLSVIISVALLTLAERKVIG